MVKDSRMVFRSKIGAILIRGGRIMGMEEEPQQVGVSDLLRVEDQLNRLDVAGSTTSVHIPIGGGWSRSAGVSCRAGQDPLAPASHGVEAPKASGTQGGYLGRAAAFVLGADQWCLKVWTNHKMASSQPLLAPVAQSRDPVTVVAGGSIKRTERKPLARFAGYRDSQRSAR